MMRRLILLPLLMLQAASAAAQTGARVGSSWQPDLAGPADYLRALPRTAVVSAAQFGARPGDGRDDGPAIASALQAARAKRGGAVLLPPGEYAIGGTILLPSGVALLGTGCGRTVVRRAAGHRGQILMRLDGARNVRVQGISFEHDGAPPFTRSIGFYGHGSSDVAILDNCFNDARPIGGNRDRWAIELSAERSPSRNVWIGRNRASGSMQLTAGGGIGIDVLRIVDNEVLGGRNAAIAVTHTVSGAWFRDLLIARNRIEHAHGIGIYIGPDKPTARSSRFEDVTVSENDIARFSGAIPYGIYVRAAERGTERISIVGNRIDAAGHPRSIAICFIDKHGGGVRRATDVLIERNVVQGFDRGLWLDHVDGASIRGNSIDAARPLLIAPQTNARIDLQT